MTEQKRKRVNWTPEAMATLKRMATTQPVAIIAKHFGTTERAVRRQIGRMGITLQGIQRPTIKRRTVHHPPRRWTPQEEQFVAAHYGTMPTRKIAQRLKRSFASVWGKVYKLQAHEELRHDAEMMMTSTDVAEFLGVTKHTVGTWWKDNGLPYHVRGKIYLAYEGEILKWLRTDANILRLTRDAIEPRLQRLYDAVRGEHYTLDELNALDVPALMPRQWKWGEAQGCGASPPKAIIIGRNGGGNFGASRQSRVVYYRKDEVRAWAYAWAHVIPENVKHPDIADVVLAWQSRYLLNAELHAFFLQGTVSKWRAWKGFPRQVKFRMYYDRLAVVAWCKANGHADIARALYRGVPLCYDEVIRERERRSGLTRR